MTRPVAITGHRFNPKTGKLERIPPRSVSAKIKQNKSKKQKVVRRTV